MASSLQNLPGPFFGEFGGRYMPEALVAALDELTSIYEDAKQDPSFGEELTRLHRTYSGRPSIITEVPRFAEHAGGVRVFLKREDLNHTGSHKINNVLGQALLTKRVGKKRVIAETGAGQHGVATATAAALFDLDCTVYMGEEDTKRQALNVARMRHCVTGSPTWKPPTTFLVRPQDHTRSRRWLETSNASLVLRHERRCLMRLGDCRTL